MGAPTGWVAKFNDDDIVHRPSFKKSTLPHRYFRQIASKMGIEVSFVDMRTPENASAALKPNTKLVWIETPTNPTLKIVDIKAVSDLVHQQVGSLAQLFYVFFSSVTSITSEIPGNHLVIKYSPGFTKPSQRN